MAALFWRCRGDKARRGVVVGFETGRSCFKRGLKLLASDFLELLREFAVARIDALVAHECNHTPTHRQVT